METDVTLHKNQLIAFLEPLSNTSGVERINKILKDQVTHNYHVDIPRLPDAISVGGIECKRSLGGYQCSKRKTGYRPDGNFS